MSLHYKKVYVNVGFNCRHSQWSFFSQTPENQFAPRGIDKLAYFPYRDDTVALVQAVRKMMFSLIQTIYPTDAAVQADLYLQNFALEASTIIRGFPSSFQTQSDVSQTLAHLQYIASIGHASVNVKTAGWTTAYPGSPMALFKPVPVALGTVTDANLNEWIGSAQSVVSSIAFQLNFQRPLQSMYILFFFFVIILFFKLIYSYDV